MTQSARWTLALTLLSFVVMAPNADATPEPVPDQVHRLPLSGALVQNTVTAQLQDRRGLMWFGTLGGLNVYDGYEFRRFPSHPRDASALAEVDIAALHEDAAGHIWVAGFQGWLDRIEPSSGRVSHYGPRLLAALHGSHDVNAPPSRGSAGFVEAVDGGLWIGNSLGLHRYWPAEDRLTSIHTLGPVTDLASAGEGSLWLGGPQGLIRWHPEHGVQAEYRHAPHDPRSLSDNGVTRLLVDPDGGLWVGTGHGLNYLPPAGTAFQRFQHDVDDPQSLGGNVVLALLRDRQGRLWVGGQSGGLSLKIERGFHVLHHEPDNPLSLAVDDVWSLYQDRSGLIWVGTAGGGLNQINPLRFRFDSLRAVPHSENSLRSPFVWDIVGDRHGRLWMTTLAGLERFDPADKTFRLFQPTPGERASNQLQSLLLDRDGTLWVGSVEGVLYRFDADNEQFEQIIDPSRSDGRLGNGRVWYLSEDPDTGQLWISAGNEWLRFDRDQRQVLERHQRLGGQSLVGAAVRVSLYDSDGVLWLGGGNALLRREPGAVEFQAIQHDPQQSDSLSESSVRALYEDPQGNLWIGTQNGLNRLSAENRRRQIYRFDLFSAADGMSNSTVYGILADSSGALWISTNAGLSRFDPQDQGFDNFDAGDGLQANEMNGGAEWQAADGRLYFGGVAGVVHFHPADISPHQHVPAVLFTDVGRLGKDRQRVFHPPSGMLELGPHDLGLSLGFAVADYHVPEKNRFRYRLLGQSEQWVETTRPHFELIRPAAGDYRLELLGAQRDDVWSEQPAILEIRVHPPWWATRSAYLAYALGLGLLAWAYHQAQRARLQREREFSQQLAQAQSLAEANYRLAERHAQIDTLTELPNRASLMEALERYLRVTQASRTPLALLVINLDRFQRINDTLGHQAGDQILRKTAERLAAQVRGEDWLARVGSDEFALIAVGQSQERSNAWLDTLTTRLAGAIGAAHELQDPPLRVTASIGICSFRHEDEQPGDLYTRADIAMHLAKQAGGNCMRHYVTGQREQQQARLNIESRLRGAVQRNEMRAVYQPLIDLRSGHLSGFESLIRWQPANGEPVYPDQFIPVAEESGLIVELGLWMLEEVCQRWAAWGHPDWRVAVNISAHHLRSASLVEQVDSILRHHRVPAHCLKLELTESAMMEYAESAVAQLSALRQRGVKISIDDFGTGFSSLAHLQRLPVDELKIDRSFVNGLSQGEHNRKIVRSIIQLGHALKLDVVAEGIEEPGTVAFLQGLECDIGQGYLFDRPQPADNLQRWLSGEPVQFADVSPISARQG
ncbi:EAL domain-containing protein [Pseudomarimonas arenosa]|uniref:EAL domain-containing protein n=1 Tax=Pseudomarimonas arenosa TaxID=2774145 RepID=A0AAW3ZK23_9GAMM|nr:EAL domain-containing protein [Pseudomarimonas arenosa]MBD8525874.1 EAL domain-containing protein [Pseudomarimonas arenosa]